MKEQLTNDMSVGNPAKKLFFFAVPIVLDLYFVIRLQMGASGIWWSIPIGWAAAFTIGTLRYRSGKWKEKGIVEREKDCKETGESI